MKNYLILISVVILMVLPLFVFKNGDFGGADDKAVETIQNIDKDYQPWFNGLKLFESEEITSTLFAIQAAIGAGILGYYVGFSRGRKDVKKKNEDLP